MKGLDVARMRVPFGRVTHSAAVRCIAASCAMPLAVSSSRLRAIDDAKLPANEYIVTHRPTPDHAYTETMGSVESAIVRNVPLPEKQRQVVALIGRGYQPAQIAEKLNLSVHTVNHHRRQALLRLGLKGTAGLTHYAIMRQIIQLGDVDGEED